jgi:hypothetical protein
MRLSKSQYIRGLQCHKALWQYHYRRERMAAPDANRQALFASGHEVGQLAQGLFPGGREVVFDHQRIDLMIEETARLIDSGVEIIYEATFASGDLLVMADILLRAGDHWHFYEVKSSTRIKPYHLQDAAFQWRVLGDHLRLGKAHIVHIDTRYRRQGALDLLQLFNIVDVTESVTELQAELDSRLEPMLAMLQQDSEPEIAIGPQCNSPFECDFKAWCWQAVPQPSVFNLRRLRGERKFELYRQGLVEYRDLQQQPLDRAQTLQVTSALSGAAHIDVHRLAEFIGSASYPIHFLDFETLQQAVPKFDGLQPYQQIPFQYSLHILHRHGELEHREFLADAAGDPRPALATRLAADIGAHGSIVAHSKSTEIGAINALAVACDEHAATLQSMTARFLDLLTPFRGLMYYHPDFNGNFSIKSILPAMFPHDQDADYHDLAVQDGRMAMNEYARLAQLEDPEQRRELRAALLAYCRIDTLAMVKIWQALEQLASPSH